jgi:hypothetical protein
MRARGSTGSGGHIEKRKEREKVRRLPECVRDGAPGAGGPGSPSASAQRDAMPLVEVCLGARTRLKLAA